MAKIKIRKKDGNLESFNPTKLNGGMIRAGATPQEAGSITGLIEVWVSGMAKGGIAESADIRDKVIDLLRPINPNATITFETYKKFEVSKMET